MAPVKPLPLMSKVARSGASPRVLGMVPSSSFPRKLRNCSGEVASNTSGTVPTMPLLARRISSRVDWAPMRQLGICRSNSPRLAMFRMRSPLSAVTHRLLRRSFSSVAAYPNVPLMPAFPVSSTTCTLFSTARPSNRFLRSPAILGLLLRSSSVRDLKFSSSSMGKSPSRFHPFRFSCVNRPSRLQALPTTLQKSVKGTLPFSWLTFTHCAHVRFASSPSKIPPVPCSLMIASDSLTRPRQTSFQIIRRAFCSSAFSTTSWKLKVADKV
mmetsp:Transcript_9617/g.28953  ORF Transcript_9617/g.28953 Transcript_9617/m.28953 type:complete len:269 (+) Transcript_9617:2211-3017(+)